jgi:Spy/CpxP family protein refolding chaperone
MKNNYGNSIRSIKWVSDLEKMEEVLTPEQMDQMKEERMKRRKSGKPVGK